MNLSKAITLDCVRLRLRASTKQGVIEELIDVLQEAGKVSSRKVALKAVLDREKKMTTGMRDGIAIPHGKCDAVDRLVAAVGLVPEGVPFDAMDKQDSKIFVLTISPVKRAGPHIEFLGSLNRTLIHEESREKILAAETIEQLYELLIADPPVIEDDDEDEDDGEDFSAEEE